MPKPILSVLTVLLVLSSVVVSAQTSQPPAKFVPGRVLVKFRAQTRPAAIQAAHLAVAGEVVNTFGSVAGLQLVRLPASTKLSQALATYRSNPAVQYAEPDYIVHAFQTPTDPLFTNMWSLLNSGQSGGTIGADIKATQAWNLTTGSSSVIVGVIDTGVDYNHPDLAANIFSGPICPGGVVCHGLNTVLGAVDPNDPFDDNGHGTHVSGTIGALGNNALGVTGINWNVTILPCKFLGTDGSGDVAGAIQCLDFIKSLKDTQGLNIVATNNSWGGTDFSQALEDAIDRQRQSGILFIAAAGNDFADNDLVPTYPASFPLPNIISVAATDRNDQRAFFSNVGRHTVHLGAPGQEILSTLPGGTYGIESGTSMATPHVTGVAALLSAQDPTRDWRAIKNLILSGGDPDSGLAATISGRRLDAFAAMTCANSPVSSRLAPVTDVTSASVGVPLTLSALNINCAQPAGPVQVTVSPGGQTITLTDDGVAPDVSAADGVYTGSFTPAAPGVDTLAFSTGDTVSVQVLNNYQPTDNSSAFNYRTITGTNLNLGDDDVAQIASPFPIAFGNGSFTQLWISANGTVSFSGAFSSYIHVPLPTGVPFRSVTPLVAANTLVAPFWDDLLPVRGTAQNVFWDVTGVAPNRELVVEWRDLRTFDCFNEPDTIKFEAVFFENSSNILFNYADAVFGGSCLNHDRGNLATEGVQVSDQAGTVWGFDGQDVTDGSSILWSTSTAPVTVPAAPVITSISPTVVNSFGPDFTLTVNGSNFVPESRVTLFGFSRPTTFISSTQLTALIPATDLDPWVSNNGPKSVIVQTRGFGPILESNAVQLTVNGPTPAISSLSPAAVPPGSFGFLLKISGSNFVPFSTVNVNGQPLVGSVALNPSLVTVVVPGDLLTTPGALTITVSDPDGGTSTPLTLNVSPGAPPPPIASSQNYFIEQTPGARALSTAQADVLGRRFFGWNVARSLGLDSIKKFTRPYAPIFTALAPQQTASSSLLATALPLALPGLDIPAPVPSGFLPTAIASGDFNRDGHPDWIVSNGGSNDLWVYFGNGDGTAQLPRIIPLSGQTPIAITAADLRGIGILDLIVAEPDSLSVGILLGNGDGTFAPEKIYFSPAPPLSLTVADFNRDGHPDVVVGLTGDNPTGAVAFFAGDGTGKLLTPVTTPLDREVSPATFVIALTSGDLNNDGIPDLLVTDINEQETGTFVYLGQGNGTFKKSQNLGGILNAAIADLNGDSCPDVVTIDTAGLAAAMLGHCDGTFQLLQPLGFFGEGETGIAMALADINGDGKLDLITSGVNLGVGGGFGQDSGNLVSVSFGDGLGSFEPARLYRAQTGMFGLAVVDLNGDLHPDIVVASQDTDSVSVLMNDGTGRFGGAQGHYIGWVEKGSPADNFFQGTLNAPISITDADLDGDGKKDLLSVDAGQGFDLPANLVISMNDGLGNFLPDKKIPVLDGRFQFFGNLILGDFRGTGLPDIVLTPNHLSSSFTDSFFVFVPNLGLGNFGTPVQTRISGLPGAIAAGDFNGDGKLDFVMAGGSPGQILTFLGNGDGTFAPAPAQSFISSAPLRLLVADFNGDGKLDVLVPVRGQVIEFLGNGDGTFSPPKPAISGIVSFLDPSVLFQTADLNHDGRMDLIQRNGLQDDPVPIFRIYFAQPDGSFALQNTYSPYSGEPANPGGGGVTTFNNFVGDFNGDGQTDIAALQNDPLTSQAYLQFMLGNGDGSFTPTFQRFDLGSVAPALPTLVADMNGDGKADFIELDGFTSAFNVVHSGSGEPFTLQYVSLPVIGTTGTLRVTLSAASAQDTVLQLSASDPGITVPPSITVPAGSLSASATLTVSPAFDPSHTFTVTATDGLNSSSALASVAIPGKAVGFLTTAGTQLFEALLPGQSSRDIGFGVSSRGGYQTTVNAHCEGLPAGVTCQFGNATLQLPPGGFVSTPLTLAVTSALPVGDYTFNVIASDVAISQSVAVTFHVGDFAMQLTSQSGAALSTGFENFQLSATSLNHFVGGVNLTCSGLPAGATCLTNNTIVGAGLGGPSAAGIGVNTSGLAVGDYPFAITGDTAFTQHSVNAILHVGDFGSASVTPPSATLNVGQSATFNLTVSSVNGFGGTVELLCSPTVNNVTVNGISCSFSPVSATFDSTGKLSAQIKVTATAHPRGANVPQRASAPPPLRWYGGFAAFLLLAIVLAGSPRKRKGTFGLCCLAILALATIAACGGGGSNSNPAPPVPTPTPAPPQTVNVDVIGISREQIQAPSKKLTSFSVTVP